MKLGEIGEFGFIGRIAARIAEGKGVRVGIGDDAAVTEVQPGYVLLTTSDMLIEQVHFDLAFTDPYRLGKKSLAVNLSDIAAMGGEPRHFLLSLAIPVDLPLEFLDRFIEGVLAMADQYGVILIGGDTCRSSAGLVVSITLHGEQLPDRVVCRAGARPGDAVFVTGTVGDSALGLAQLRQGETAGPAVDRHLDPVPRVRAGIALAEAGFATAMIDISDGLLADLGHIAERSGVGARVDAEQLPISPFFRAAASRLSTDHLALALAGGEDYELLFTAPAPLEERIIDLMAALGVMCRRIGTITAAGSGIVVTGEGGRTLAVPRAGFNHFSGT
ncbi:thiamine-monophosphate kinase [Geotalea uraniireducens]|uniref:Thiamine-monophosphate kinase n=1 Tax=Geotalea uraniireducens TaxID=351604 RepID=A0ABM8EG25_9BACT|nr:thiamine-phosphate kinase [Geotalea uraniireducens]BDV41351.1 thiamine-monophosphate kinase [Geotalea uraniireducens]